MAEFVKIPSYSLSPDKITLFERVEWFGFSDDQIRSFENLKNNESKYNELSEGARKRLKTAVEYMLYMSKTKFIIGNKKESKEIADNEIIIEKGNSFKNRVGYKLTFITLTLSSKQIHSDKEITRSLLGSFLDSLRRKWKADQYIWKAEKQENGNIHYHIITNKYIHWQEIQEVWNRIQNKKDFGYVDAYSKKMKKHFKNGFKVFENDKRTEKQQRKAYERNKKNKWTQPNSTDIHALYKVKNIAAYITKYVSKPVTKTSRILEIDKLMFEIEAKEFELKKLKEQNLLLSDFSNVKYLANIDQISKLESEVPEQKKELEKLKNKGVTGRIWGQSRNLSKIKPFSDVENHGDIPNIDIVDKIKRFKHEFDISENSRVVTFYFDILKTPELKQILDEHIHDCLNGKNLFDKLTFDKAESDFESQKYMPVLETKPNFNQEKLAI